MVKQVSSTLSNLLAPFSILHLTTHHSNLGVRFRRATAYLLLFFSQLISAAKDLNPTQKIRNKYVELKFKGIQTTCRTARRFVISSSVVEVRCCMAFNLQVGIVESESCTKYGIKILWETTTCHLHHGNSQRHSNLDPQLTTYHNSAIL